VGIVTLNPATATQLAEFAPLTDADLETKLQRAVKGFQSFRNTPLEARSATLMRAAELLEQRQETLGQLMTLEMGKPIVAARGEVAKCALVCRYYAEAGARFLADVPITTDARESFVRYQPLGVILAVMPWNFPFWQVFRFVAPALMAGNVALLKHASNVPQCAQAIEDLLGGAGFGEGVFQNLFLESSRVAALVQDPRIQAATLTGSEPAGASLAAACGRALKKTVLELGGSDPFIVMPSADVAEAARVGTIARMLNTGQTCISAKRFIVLESVADAFTEQLLLHFQALKVGDPMDPATDLGPLATANILQELDRQVQACVAAGATVLLGGQPLQGSDRLPETLRSGYFYPPTLLTDIPPDAAARQEEFFGPVGLLFRVRDLDEAIALANGTPFGLGASAWTQDAQERDRLVAELEAGAVFINGLVKSDPRLPFGGIKRSGYGRELAAEGMREFLNIKSVWIA